MQPDPLGFQKSHFIAIGSLLQRCYWSLQRGSIPICMQYRLMQARWGKNSDEFDSSAAEKSWLNCGQDG
jgi:hypothetical protein